MQGEAQFFLSREICFEKVQTAVSVLEKLIGRFTPRRVKIKERVYRVSCGCCCGQFATPAAVTLNE